MNYSITNEIDGATVAGEIAALQAYSRKSVLVVEGVTDARLFKNFIDNEQCSIVIAHGWENAIDGLMIVRGDNRSGVLLVQDLDFRLILGSATNDPDIVYTSEHDIEIMLFASPAFEKVLNELSSESKVSSVCAEGFDLRELVYSMAKPIGALRLYAQENSISLIFDDYDYRHISKSMTFDLPDFIRAIFARSRIPLSDAETVSDYVSDKVENIPSQLLCCGHDVCASFGRSLQKKLGTQNACSVSLEIIERSLRLAYGAAEFFNTHLHQQIKAWEGRNTPYLVLAV